VARLGGDEFAVILPAAGEGRTVERMAAKLVDALAQPFVIEATELRVDLSIGAAMYPAHGDDVSTLTRLADIAMYEAKRSGTGFAVYSADAGAGLPLRLALASQMPAAMDKDQLVLHFQPKAAIGSGRPVAIEALVRWEHPSLGLLPPDRFIPLAEETGQIKPLARWVLQRAIAECARWRAAGWDLPVAVNLSGRERGQTSQSDTCQAKFLHRSHVGQFLGLRSNGGVRPIRYFTPSGQIGDTRARERR